MSKEADEYTQSEIVRIYPALGKYYTDISRDFSKILFNWIFVLNTGGIALAVTFMGALRPTPENKDYFIGIVVLFVLGITSIFLAAQFEHARFKKKGRLLDKSFDDFQDKKLAPDQFIDCITKNTPCYDKIVPALEWMSYIFFLGGLALSLHMLKIVN